MKLELKIEAPGVQVYAYEIDAATKELLKENANNVFKETGIPELDEEEKKRILDALSSVQDPDLKKDIVSLGFFVSNAVCFLSSSLNRW